MSPHFHVSIATPGCLPTEPGPVFDTVADALAYMREDLPRMYEDAIVEDAVLRVTFANTLEVAAIDPCTEDECVQEEVFA